MGEVVLVTGASAGRLHQRGWEVVGASRRGTSAGGWTPVVIDVDLDTSVAAGFEQLLATDHRLDAVVASAGWGLAGAVEVTPVEQAKEQMETNFGEQCEWSSTRCRSCAVRVTAGSS